MGDQNTVHDPNDFNNILQHGIDDGFNSSVSANCYLDDDHKDVGINVFGVSNFSAVPTNKYGDSYIENNGYNQ